MTEKRFNVFDVDGTVFLEDHKEGSYHIGEKENVDIHCLNDIADRLNTYADENEQLKSELGKLNILYKAKCKTEEQLLKMGKEVEKENEQLKSENNMLKVTIGRNEAYIKRLTETSIWRC